MQIRIIADDFTSALDGTACFAQRGWSTEVFIDVQKMSDVAVASMDTGTRESSATHARATVSAAATAWKGADILIKQFDSTLRGYVPEECLAALMASGRRKLLIAPAFPSAGRTTENGCVYVDGVPVHLTAFAMDPTRPVTVSSVPDIFKAYEIEVKVARDVAHARLLLDTFNSVVVDARTEEDMDKIVRGFIQTPHLLWAGSTGLLRSIARMLPEPKRVKQAVDVFPEVRSQNPWLVVGSLNPHSRRQLTVARLRQGVNALATDEMPASNQEPLDGIVKEAVNLLRIGLCDGLVVTGGETARKIIDALPAISLQVCREIETGTPLMFVKTMTLTFPMITKAGGFGNDNALLKCIDALTGVGQ